MNTDVTKDRATPQGIQKTTRLGQLFIVNYKHWVVTGD